MEEFNNRLSLFLVTEYHQFYNFYRQYKYYIDEVVINMQLLTILKVLFNNAFPPLDMIEENIPVENLNQEQIDTVQNTDDKELLTENITKYIVIYLIRRYFALDIPIQTTNYYFPRIHIYIDFVNERGLIFPPLEDTTSIDLPLTDLISEGEIDYLNDIMNQDMIATSVANLFQDGFPIQLFFQQILPIYYSQQLAQVSQVGQGCYKRLSISTMRRARVNSENK